MTTRREEPVFVLVLNWNAEADTAACLDSLLAQRDVTLEIVLIDNDSADGSGERLRARYAGSIAHYLQTGANLGYAGGNNRGIEFALVRGARWIVVINNDTVADPDCLASLLSAIQTDDRIAALAPLITRFDDPERIWFAGGRFDRMRALGVHVHAGEPVRQVVGDQPPRAPVWTPCTFLTGCCLLLRGEAIAEGGAFREDFFAYVEDVELSMRLRQNGWRIGWVPSARIAHRVPAEEAAPSPMQIMLRDRNRRRLVRDTYPVGWRLLFALWFWPTRIAHLARYLVTADAPRVRGLLAGMTAR